MNIRGIAAQKLYNSKNIITTTIWLMPVLFFLLSDYIKENFQVLIVILLLVTSIILLVKL